MTYGVGTKPPAALRDFAGIEVKEQDLIEGMMQTVEHYKKATRKKFTLADDTIRRIEGPLYELPGKVIDPLHEKIKQIGTQLQAANDKLKEIATIAQRTIAAEKAGLAEGQTLNPNLLLLEQSVSMPGKLPKESKAAINHPYIQPAIKKLNKGLTALSEELTLIMKDARNSEIDTDNTELRASIEKLTVRRTPEKNTDYTDLTVDFSKEAKKSFEDLEAVLISLIKPIERKLRCLEKHVEKYRAKIKIEADHVPSVAIRNGTTPAEELEEMEKEATFCTRIEERHDKLAVAYATALILIEEVGIQLYIAESHANIMHDVNVLSTTLSGIGNDIEILKKRTRACVSFETEKESLLETLKGIIGRYNIAKVPGAAYKESAESTIKTLSEFEEKGRELNLKLPKHWKFFKFEEKGRELDIKLSKLKIFNGQLKATILNTHKDKKSSTSILLTNTRKPLKIEWESVVRFLSAQEDISLGTFLTAHKDRIGPLAYEIDRAFYAIAVNKGSIPWDTSYRLSRNGYEKQVYSPFEEMPLVAAAPAPAPAAPAPEGEDLKLKGEAAPG